ncbi:cell surface glycoprotein CD200 receptor 4-like [Carettochelys insculpta]|uniref:cell surface glycoprotein CD200 receptor 4-like n=1 Tax=Carettochelys insculpta TaxID=44489 RepID=UPI003EBC1026
MSWESNPGHNPVLQIYPVKLADEGNYNCEISTGDGTVDQVSVLTVLVPPVVTLTHESNGLVVCQASAGKPAAEISWAQGYGYSTENKTHHTNGTVTILSSLLMANITTAHVTCIVVHPALNQTQTIALSTNVALSPIVQYSLISASSCVAIAVIALILYWTLKSRASCLCGLANTTTVLNTTENNLHLTSRPGNVDKVNSYATESIYQNYSVQNMDKNVNPLKRQRQRV